MREVPESVRVLDNAVQEPGRLGQGLQEMGQKIPQVVDMIPTSVEAERLYSLSAVLTERGIPAGCFMRKMGRLPGRMRVQRRC